jgi:hypothetical protein
MHVVTLVAEATLALGSNLPFMVAAPLIGALIGTMAVSFARDIGYE